MPPSTQRVLMLEGPRQVRFAEKALPPLGPGDAVVRSLYSTFKHGTEMMAYLGLSPFAARKFNPRLRLFERETTPQDFYPRPLGNMVVGEVVEAGAGVRGLAAGQLVYAWAPIADIHVLPTEKLQPLGALSPEQALAIDPASFALGGVLDGAIAAGESVLVTGLGAIGLFAVQYAKAKGARVLAASSFAPRRRLAERFGAAHSFDSKAHGDLARDLKQQTGGVDAAIECSGSIANLTLAIRAARQCGRVVCVGFYGPADERLNLGEEFFHNRISLLASLPAFGWNNPVRGPRPLYAKDLQKIVADDLSTGTITADGILDPVVPFADAAGAVQWIADQPERVIKVLVRHG